MKNKIKKQIPNIITISRIISLIIGLIFFCQEKFILALIFYIYGAISDFLDGYFARKFNAYSKLGKYLDAISDKLYSFSVMILLIIFRNILVIIPLILEIIISYINFKILELIKIVSLNLYFSTQFHNFPLHFLSTFLTLIYFFQI